MIVRAAGTYLHLNFSTLFHQTFYPAEMLLYKRNFAASLFYTFRTTYNIITYYEYF
jgi:hypothetical protein